MSWRAAASSRPRVAAVHGDRLVVESRRLELVEGIDAARLSAKNCCSAPFWSLKAVGSRSDADQGRDEQHGSESLMMLSRVSLPAAHVVRPTPGRSFLYVTAM